MVTSKRLGAVERTHYHFDLPAEACHYVWSVLKDFRHGVRSRLIPADLSPGPIGGNKAMMVKRAGHSAAS